MIATDLRGVKAANLLNCGVTCVFRDFNLAGSECRDETSIRKIPYLYEKNLYDF
jgi:hypothetical protein